MTTGGGTGTPVTYPTVTTILPTLVNDSYNCLSLEEWREQIGYNPWHFYGMGGMLAPVSSSCNSIVKQYSWQSTDSAGRADILQAIIKAEQKLKAYLNYSVGPHYAEVVLPWPRWPKQDNTRFGNAGADGRWISFNLPEGNVIAIGTEAITHIATPSVVYTDEDGDGLSETFSISCITTLTSADNVAVYISATDRLNHDGVSEKWRVRPIQASISGGTLTVTGRAWQLIRPILYEKYMQEPLDPSLAANFVTTLEVYQRYTYADGNDYNSAQAILIWETPPYPQWAITLPIPGGAGLDPAATAYSFARVGIRNAANGTVYLGEAIWDATENQWNAVPWYASAYRYRPPDRVKIRYYAGLKQTNTYRLQPAVATTVTRLAAAELTRRICACDNSNRELQSWQFDLSSAGGANGEVYQGISPGDLNNPFGTRRGQVSAWRDVKGTRFLHGFSI